jgi:hypothetical protein
MLAGRLCRVAIFAYFAMPLCFGQGAVPVLTLDDAISLAKEQNGQIQISTLELTKAIEQTNELKTQRLPAFKVYATVGASLLPINLTVPIGRSAVDATLQNQPGLAAGTHRRRRRERENAPADSRNHPVSKTGLLSAHANTKPNCKC